MGGAYIVYHEFRGKIGIKEGYGPLAQLGAHRHCLGRRLRCGWTGDSGLAGSGDSGLPGPETPVWRRGSGVSAPDSGLTPDRVQGLPRGFVCGSVWGSGDSGLDQSGDSGLRRSGDSGLGRPDVTAQEIPLFR